MEQETRAMMILKTWRNVALNSGMRSLKSLMTKKVYLMFFVALLKSIFWLGSMCQQDIDELSKWTLTLNATKDKKQLTDSGKLELNLLGKRIREMFGELIQVDNYNKDNFKVITKSNLYIIYSSLFISKFKSFE